MSVRLRRKGSVLNVNEHYLLNGLDRANQHPISAIIGLQDSLNEKYVIPANGIPDSDLEERYLKVIDFETEKSIIFSFYAKCEQEIEKLRENVDANTEVISQNSVEISSVKNQIEIIRNLLDGLTNDSITDHVCGGSAYIKQEEFTATDSDRVFEIDIIDTDNRVIEPTVLKVDADGTLPVAKLGVDYEISYPNDEILRVTFLNNGDYRINYIAGSLTDTEFDILLDYIKQIESSIHAGLAGSGTIIRPSHNVQFVYEDGTQRVKKEIYTGDVEKEVEYEYDQNDNIIKKTVIQGNVVKVATYLYDTNNRLIEVEDNGTDIPINGMAPLKYKLDIEYDANGHISREIYSGGVNKVIKYVNSLYGDVLEKTVEEGGMITRAEYIYDQNGKLVEVIDNGTEKMGVYFPIDVNSGGSGSEGSSNLDYEVISDAEIDLIFSTIFK